MHLVTRVVPGRGREQPGTNKWLDERKKAENAEEPGQRGKGTVTRSHALDDTSRSRNAEQVTAAMGTSRSAHARQGKARQDLDLVEGKDGDFVRSAKPKGKAELAHCRQRSLGLQQVDRSSLLSCVAIEASEGKMSGVICTV